jgi:hypothetical protein
MTYGHYKLFIDFKVVIETKRLSIVNISSDRLYRLKLMKSLKDNGFSNSEISEFLNVNGIRPLRTDKPYSPKLVWMSLKKYQHRLDRYDTDTLVELSETLCVTPLTKENSPIT